MDRADRAGLWLGLAAAATATSIWSSYILVTRLGLLTALSAWDIAAIRFAGGSLVLLPFLLRRGLPKLPLGRALVLCLTGGVGFIAIISIGLQLAPAAHGAILLPGMYPLTGALVAWMLLGERLGPTRIAGLALIAAGIGFLFAETATGQGLPGQGLGHLLLVIGNLTWIAFTVLTRRWGSSAMDNVILVTMGSAVLFLPVYALFLPGKMSQAGFDDLWPQFLVQAVLGTVIATFTYTAALRRLGAALTTVVTAACPAMVTLAAIPLLGEVPTPLTIAGLVAVTVGIVVSVGHALRRGLG